MVRKRDDYLLSAAGKIASAVLGLVSSAFYIRYLGIALKGQYSYINEAAGLLSIVFSLGLHQSYARQTRLGGTDLPRRYAMLYAGQFVLLLALAGAFSCLIPALGGDGQVWMILLQVPFLVLMTQTESMAMVENIRAYVAADLVFKGCLTVLYILLWAFFPTDLRFLILPVQAFRLGKSIALMAVSGVFRGRGRAGCDRVLLRQAMSFGVLPMLSTLLITFNYTLDILLLKRMGTAEELSLYTLAALVINYVWLIPDAFKEVLLSRVARSESGTEVRVCIKGSILLVLCCFLLFALLGKGAIRLVFGAEFVPAWGVVMILFIGAVSMIFYKMLGVVLITEGRTGIYFAILLVSVFLNAVSNLLLIPVYGMTGAAWSSVLSYTLCGALFLFSYARLTHTRVRDYLLSGPEERAWIRSALGKGD